MATGSRRNPKPQARARTRQRVGVVGIGRLGEALAELLLARGCPVVVCSRTEEHLDGFVSRHRGANYIGAGDLRSLAELLPAPRIVAMCVPAGASTAEVADELEGRLDRGDVVLDFSAEDAALVESRANAFMRRGVGQLDVGVLGGAIALRSGEATLCVGGVEGAYRALKPLLGALAGRAATGDAAIGHVGDAGSGALARQLASAWELGEWQLREEERALLASLAPSADAARTLPPLAPRLHLLQALRLATQHPRALGMLAAVADRLAPTSVEGDRRLLAGPRPDARGIDAHSLAADARSALEASQRVFFLEWLALWEAAGAAEGRLEAWRAVAHADVRLHAARVHLGGDPALTAAQLRTAPSVTRALERHQVGWRNAVTVGVQHGVPLLVTAGALAAYDLSRISS